MSILLEALKKSEEQRQLGKTPSIHSPGSEPPGNRAGNQQWIPLTLMAVSAIAMAWIGWQQYRLPAGLEDGAGLARNRGDVQIDAGVDAEAQSAADSVDVAEAQAASDAGRPAVDDGAAAADRPADAIVARRPGVSLRTPVESYRSEPESAQAATVPPPSEVQAEEPQTAPPRPSRAETHVAEPHVAEPISYWELPQGVRDTLPDLHITVLVYAERPKDRFLLVSGRRMVEKDALEGGVVLEEIRRDGAVFQYRSYRFLLKG